MKPPNVSKLNDLKSTRSPDSVEDTIHNNSKPTLSFLSLLLGSSIICTLGLLMNNSAVIIGGMIISPLVWPILSVALGVSFSQNKDIKKSLLILLMAIVAAYLSAAVVTLVSPIKMINAEITARIEPTFLDIIIACVAGFVAALGVSHKRISSSLAGVAIATSLLPPLCVSAIGIALLDIQIFSGALLLFAANVASILFVAIITFSIVGLKKKKFSELRLKAMLVTATVLIIIANPLLTLLENQSFELLAYPTVKDILTQKLESYSPNITLDAIEVTTHNNGQMLVTTNVLLPSDLSIDYEQQKELVGALETALERPVNLKLQLQRTISILSEADQQKSQLKNKLSGTFHQVMSQQDHISVDSLQMEEDSDGFWQIQAVVRSDAIADVSINLPKTIKEQILADVGLETTVQLEIIPRQTLSSEDESIQDQLKTELQKALLQIHPELELTLLTIDDQLQPPLVTLQIKSPETLVLAELDTAGLERLVQRYVPLAGELQIEPAPEYTSE